MFVPESPPLLSSLFSPAAPTPKKRVKIVRSDFELSQFDGSPEVVWEEKEVPRVKQSPKSTEKKRHSKQSSVEKSDRVLRMLQKQHVVLNLSVYCLSNGVGTSHSPSSRVN